MSDKEGIQLQAAIRLLDMNRKVHDELILEEELDAREREQRVQFLEEEIKRLSVIVEQSREELSSVYSSKSWRATAFFRVIHKKIKGLLSVAN